MYFKDFNAWNVQKQRIEKGSGGPHYVLEKEVWWCSLGINIGAEIDGKHDMYERPVLILKHINKHTILIAPCTSKDPRYKYSIKIHTPRIDSFLNFAQTRVISKKRLLRRIGILDDKQFAAVKRLLVAFVS